MTVNYSALRSESRVKLEEAVPLAGPLSVYVEPTNICNFRCKFCPESFEDFYQQSGGRFQLAPGDFELILREIKTIGTVKTLNFYMMGEPFANRNLLKYIRQSKESRAVERLIVTSNGTLLKHPLYGDICTSGLDYIRISIYGAFEETHHERTGSSFKLDRIKEQIRALKKYRDNLGLTFPKIYIKMIQVNDPLENSTFLREFAPLGDEVALEPIMNWNDPKDGNLSQMSTEDLQATSYFAHRKKVCPFPFYTVVIHSDLKVSVCCVDWNKKVVIGDLRKTSLLQIWNGIKLNNIQRAHLLGRRDQLEGCRDCTYLHTAPDNLDSLSVAEFDKRRVHNSALSSLQPDASFSSLGCIPIVAGS